MGYRMDVETTIILFYFVCIKLQINLKFLCFNALFPPDSVI